MHKLWLRLGKHRSQTTVVELHEWHSPWADVAELVKVSRNEKEPRVYVYAYSYGGWGFVRFARELERRGIAIEAAVLCDAVYRSRLRLFRWQAIFGRPTIVVPGNVKTVRWFFQRSSLWRRVKDAIDRRTLDDLPCGHELVAESNGTRIYPGIPCASLGHSSMDDHPVFHRWCESVAEAAHKVAA